MQRFTGVVKHLIIINVLFFIAKQGLGLDSFALYFPETEHFQPYQIITHMFMHGGLMHILFNMFALWMFGSSVESVWGPKKFLAFYLIAGLGAALFTIGIDYYQYINSTETFYYSAMLVMLLFFPFPVKAKYFIPVIVGMDIFSGLTGVSIFSPSNTAYWAHVGGALTGLLLVLYFKKTQFNNNRWN